MASSSFSTTDFKCTAQVRLLQQDGNYEGPKPTTTPHGQATVVSLEILNLNLRFTTSLDNLIAQFWNACQGRRYTDENGCDMKDTLDRDDITRVVVEWEPDSRNQQAWTEVRNRNMEAVMRRLKVREERFSDVIVFLH